MHVTIWNQSSNSINIKVVFIPKNQQLIICTSSSRSWMGDKLTSGKKDFESCFQVSFILYHFEMIKNEN